MPFIYTPSIFGFAGALREYGHARDLDPLGVDSYYLQGLVQLKIGDSQGAFEALRRAQFLQPDFWPASFLLAGLHDGGIRPSGGRG